jgi:hypothetical protein
MDTQDGQIKNLQMRVEVLEMKVRALQVVNGYRAADEQQPSPGTAPIAPSSRVEQPVTR